MFRSPVLSEILSLDPERDNQRIVFLSTRIDFPFDTVRALELALFRTFGSPRVSSLLDRTAEFQRSAQKHYDDTDIIGSEIMDFGHDSERGRAAIRRMNHLHGRFEIPDEDFLHVLSTFILEPIRFNERYGWRRMSDHEQHCDGGPTRTGITWRRLDPVLHNERDLKCIACFFFRWQSSR